MRLRIKPDSPFAVRPDDGPSGFGIGLKDMDGLIVEDNLIVDNRVGLHLDNSPMGDVTARSHDADRFDVRRRWLRWRLLNDGQPVSPAILNRLFDPFVGENSPGQPESIGLGLAISRDLARRMGRRVCGKTTRGPLGCSCHLCLLPPLPADVLHGVTLTLAEGACIEQQTEQRTVDAQVGRELSFEATIPEDSEWARAQAVLTSVLCTARQQDQDVFALLTDLLRSPQPKLLDILPKVAVGNESGAAVGGRAVEAPPQGPGPAPAMGFPDFAEVPVLSVGLSSAGTPSFFSSA